MDLESNHLPQLASTLIKRSGKVTVHKKKGTITWMDTKEAEGYQLLVADNREMKNGKKFPFGKVGQIGADQITMPRGSYYIAIRQYIMRNGKRFVSAYLERRGLWWNKNFGSLRYAFLWRMKMFAPSYYGWAYFFCVLGDGKTYHPKNGAKEFSMVWTGRGRWRTLS